MKNILIILDGMIAKTLLQKVIDYNTKENKYDVIYMNDIIIPNKKPSNFTFYKFDPTSLSKLEIVLDKIIHTSCIISLSNKEDILNVIKNIRNKKRIIQINILDYWGLNIEDDYISIYNGIDILANGMVERLPNIPVLAQNIGLRQGEIMEINIPFGSSYAYRYIRSIEQKEWKIFALYRRDKLLTLKPSIILKPNDIILIIGKPKVLMQVYNAIIKTSGQFPMPFGNSIYLYLDLYNLTIPEFKKLLLESKNIHKKLKTNTLIVRITNPTNTYSMNYIKNELKDISNKDVKIDYDNRPFDKILQKDIQNFDIGLIVLSYQLLKFKGIINKILDLQIPIFKVGKNSINSIKETTIFLNDIKSYEQISPIIFDISKQLKTTTKIFNINPIDYEKKIDILDHFENLSKIFNQKIQILSNNKNPIKELKKQKDILQILPLKKNMFKKRYFSPFFYINSDLLSFDINSFNQIIIPIIEE